MGFSLKHFFEQLEQELTNGSIFTIVGRMRKVITEAKEYAIACRAM